MYYANINVDLIVENVIQINGGIIINVDVSKKCPAYEKDHVVNPVTCSCENGNYLANIMDDSAISCDEVKDVGEEAKSNVEAKTSGEKTKTITTNFNEKKATGKTQNLYILFAFLLITIALLIDVSIYCYLIKYQAKQKQLLPFHSTNCELKQVLY